MTAAQNILILTSNTGGGHRSAARALEDSLMRHDPERVLVKITQVLEEANIVTRWMADLYNYLLREHQDWMKYYYTAVHTLKPNESKLIFKAALGYGLRLFERFYPSIIVSVHPMTQHFFAYILRRLNLIDKIPIVTVVTDPCYGFWRGWACDDVRQYYVATDDARRQLVEFGVPENKIEIVGMPVHRSFHPVSGEERRSLRADLGLHPDKFTVFINSGWVGGGNVPQIFESLVRSNLDIQAIFLAGQNDRLIAEATRTAREAQFPIRVVGYTDHIHTMMNASDIMVSKLGGLTTFEALASQLPIIADTVTPPMPQEAQTATFIQKHGAGVLLERPDEIVSVVQSLIESPERFARMREAALRFGKPGASDTIAQSILESIRGSA